MVMVLLIKPLNKGKAEIERPPIMVSQKEKGIYLYNPPNLLNLVVPKTTRGHPTPI